MPGIFPSDMSQARAPLRWTARIEEDMKVEIQKQGNPEEVVDLTQ